MTNTQVRNGEVWNWTAREVMRHGITVLQENDPLAFGKYLLQWTRSNHLPVESGDGRFCGILDMADIPVEIPESASVSDAMLTDIRAVTLETRVTEIIHTMQDHELQCVPVLSNGFLAGIILKEDIRSAEELLNRASVYLSKFR